MEVLIQHIEDVRNMYQSFNKGDIPTILKKLDKECIWEVMGTKEIPYAGIFHGPNDIKSFFETLNSSAETIEMTPEHLFEESNLVTVTGHWKARVRKNKKLFSTNWLMTFEYNEAGKVIHFKDCYDTLTVAKAFGL